GHGSCPSPHLRKPRQNCADWKPLPALQAFLAGWDGTSSRFPSLGLVAARRPFQHTGEMIIIAVRRAFTERQGARQVTIRFDAIVVQQFFQPRPALGSKLSPALV